MVLVLKVYPMLLAILLAIQMFPQLDFVLPFPFSDQLFAFVIGYVALLNIVEFIGLWEENKHRISGLGFHEFIPLLLGVVGLALITYLLLTPYEYNDSNVNQWLAIYLSIGAVAIFWLAKEQIFFHKALKRDAMKKLFR